MQERRVWTDNKLTLESQELQWLRADLALSTKFYSVLYALRVIRFYYKKAVIVMGPSQYTFNKPRCNTNARQNF